MLLAGRSEAETRPPLEELVLPHGVVGDEGGAVRHESEVGPCRAVGVCGEDREGDSTVRVVWAVAQPSVNVSVAWAVAQPSTIVSNEEGRFVSVSVAF